MFKPASFKLVTKTIGRKRKTWEMDLVPMDDIAEANRVCLSFAGHKSLYGLTEDGRLYKFIKEGRWAKRDFDRMRKELGIVECATHACFRSDTVQLKNRRLAKVVQEFSIEGKTWVEVDFLSVGGRL